MPSSSSMSRIGHFVRRTFLKPAIIQHKFNMKGSLSSIFINPNMVEYLLEALEQLSEESGQPLETYKIIPNMYVNEKVAYVVNDKGELTVVGFTTDIRDFFGGEE